MSVWPSVPLDAIAAVFNGRTPSKVEQRSAGHPVLKVRDVSELGEFRGRFESFVDLALADRYPEKQVHEGDTLILNAAHNAAYVASKTFRVPSTATGALATGEWLIIRPDAARLDSGFVHHWIIHPRTASLLRDLVKGIHLYPKDVARLSIPVPPLIEQKRIAAVLDQAGALRTKRRQALARLGSLLQALFSESFGDPVQNTRGFDVRPLQEIVDSGRPISYGILMPGPAQASGVKYVRVVDMKDGGIDLSGVRLTTREISQEYRRSLLKSGDLLVSIRGHVGRLAIVPPELDGANITQDTARLAIRDASPIFVRECLRTPGFQGWMAKHTKGVAVRGINLGDVKLMPIILPPREMQDRFACQAAAVERLIATQRASLAKLDALFASLQYRAFRGEL